MWGNYDFTWFLGLEIRRKELELFSNFLCSTLFFTLLWQKMGFRKRAKKIRMEEDRYRKRRNKILSCNLYFLQGRNNYNPHMKSKPVFSLFLFSPTPPLLL